MTAKALILVALTGIATLSQAAMIDDFSTGAYTIQTNSGVPVKEAVRSGSMIGLERDVLLQYLSGPKNVTAIVNGGQVQFFNSDSETSGMMTLQYDGIDGEVEDGVLNPGTNLGANLSDSTAFLFDFRFVDAGLTGSISVMTTVTTGAGSFSDTIMIPNGTNMTVSQSFASFGGADFSDVRRLDFVFSGTAAADFTLDSISTAVPGPAALLPFVTAFAIRLRRRVM